MPSTTPQRGGQGPAPSLKYAGLGIQFALTFLAFGAIGWWLDMKLGTAPWLMLAGIALGAAGAFFALVRSVPPARGERAHPEDRPREPR